MHDLYDIAVVGGGPGGVAAGIYAARKQLKALFVTESFQSQSAVSAGIENWIGTVTVSGWEFAQSLEKHLRAQEGLEIRTGLRAEKLSPHPEGGYEIAFSDGSTVRTRTVVIATGGRHRHLEVPGEDKFVGKGVVYCSTCDAPFFRGIRTAVVGGGNAGLEAVEDLLPYSTEITLVVRSGELKGDEVTRTKVLASPKVKVIYHAVTKEILGETKVTGLRYEDTTTGEEKILETDGVFVEIGMIPNTEWVKGVVELNERGEVKIDHRTAAASLPGVYAVGDATDAAYKQNNISAGYGVTAALAAYDFLRKQA